MGFATKLSVIVKAQAEEGRGGQETAINKKRTAPPKNQRGWSAESPCSNRVLANNGTFVSTPPKAVLETQISLCFPVIAVTFFQLLTI